VCSSDLERRLNMETESLSSQGTNESGGWWAIGARIPLNSVELVALRVLSHWEDNE